MATACIPQITFGFEPKGKPIVAAFDQPHASSDGGAVLLKSLDTQWELTKQLASCLADTRQAGKVQHQTLELVRQRVFGLACGYADCNDAARLADDAIHKLLLDRDPIAGRALASQPTLSRFENAVTWAPLRDMAHVLADAVIEIHRRRLKGRATRITIDLDPTDDPTHGHQQLTLFHGYYEQYQYLPLVITCAQTDDLVMIRLRHGTAAAVLGADDDLEYLVGRVRAIWPNVRLRVRGDCGFGGSADARVVRPAGRDLHLRPVGQRRRRRSLAYMTGPPLPPCCRCRILPLARPDSRRRRTAGCRRSSRHPVGCPRSCTNRGATGRESSEWHRCKLHSPGRRR